MKLYSLIFTLTISIVSSSSYALTRVSCSVVKVFLNSPQFKIKTNDQISLIEKKDEYGMDTALFLSKNGQLSANSGQPQNNTFDVWDVDFSLNGGPSIRFVSTYNSGRGTLFLQSRGGMAAKMADLVCPLRR